MIDYFKYEKLICKIAWSFNKTTGIPFTILKEEADWAFVEACIRHDPDKSAFSTFLTYYIHGQICNYLKKNTEEPIEHLETIMCESPSTQHQIEIKDTIDKASDDFKIMFDLIMENPWLSRIKKSVAKRWLSAKMTALGMRQKVISSTFNEAREIIQSWI